MRFNVPEELHTESGIYAIANDIDQRVYVGQAKHLYRRYLGHRSLLASGRHTNPLLQAFVNEHSLDRLEFRLLEACDRRSLDAREDQYIFQYKSVFQGYGFNLARSSMDIMRSDVSYTLNSLACFISNKSHRHEVDRYKNILEDYRLHFKNVSASNMCMANDVDRLEERVGLYKERCQLLEEELLRLRARVSRRKHIATPRAGQLSLFS